MVIELIRLMELRRNGEKGKRTKHYKIYDENEIFILF